MFNQAMNCVLYVFINMQAFLYHFNHSESKLDYKNSKLKITIQNCISSDPRDLKSLQVSQIFPVSVSVKLQPYSFHMMKLLFFSTSSFFNHWNGITEGGKLTAAYKASVPLSYAQYHQAVKIFMVEDFHFSRGKLKALKWSSYIL